MKTSSALAHSMNWRSSKQSYLTARLLADRDLVDDCLRAYAYFRWADDEIDIRLQSKNERDDFITRQKSIIKRSYQGAIFPDITPEEVMLVDLIGRDRSQNSGLHSFITNFMDVIEFDSKRRGRLISREELDLYTSHLAIAVMDGLQYFIGNGFPYLKNPERSMAVQGAHITHMLRDMIEDIPNGIINIPIEAISEYGITLDNLNDESFQKWVADQTKKARQAFEDGRNYIAAIRVFRCRLAGVWYLARFSCILNAIERDGYQLRLEYPERHCFATWLDMIRLGIEVSIEHVTGTIWKTLVDAIQSRALASIKKIHTNHPINNP
jgi:phytoene/squalene synthetase